MTHDNSNTFAGLDKTGGQLVVDALLGEDVNTIFGISGSHVLAIYDALRDTPQIRHITAMHENNAALMAEAYARLTGKPGVVLVTAGPGATNAVTGIAQAYTNAAPVIIITGTIPLDAKRESFHGVDDPNFLARIYSAVTKSSIRVVRPDEIPEKIARAFLIALSGRPGPVHIEIDEHVLKSKMERVPTRPKIAPKKLEPDPETMDRIVEALRRSKRPVIVAGKGVLATFAKDELAKAAEALAAPVVFPQDTTGAISYSNRWCVGTLWTMMGPNQFAISLMRDSDLLLGIGLRPEAWNLDLILRNAPQNFVFVGFDDEQTSQTGATISCVADTKRFLEQIILHFRSTPRVADEELLAQIENNKKTILQTFANALEPYRNSSFVHFGLALQELAKQISHDTIIVGDVGNHTVWSLSYLSRIAGESFINVGSWGAMGYGIPGAVGAKIACPEKRVIAVTGDGAFLMASADFATAVQNRLDVIFVILKDKRFGMVEMLQRRDYQGRTYAVDIEPPDFVKFAESFGATGIKVERPSDLSKAFEQALSIKGPVIVEIISESSVPYVPFSA